MPWLNPKGGEPAGWGRHAGLTLGGTCLLWSHAVATAADGNPALWAETHVILVKVVSEKHVGSRAQKSNLFWQENLGLLQGGGKTLIIEGLEEEEKDLEEMLKNSTSK